MPPVVNGSPTKSLVLSSAKLAGRLVVPALGALLGALYHALRGVVAGIREAFDGFRTGTWVAVRHEMSDAWAKFRAGE